MNWLKHAWNDESGTEVTELAIVLALIVAVSVALLVLIGSKVQGLYSNVQSAW